MEETQHLTVLSIPLLHTIGDEVYFTFENQVMIGKVIELTISHHINEYAFRQTQLCKLQFDYAGISYQEIFSDCIFSTKTALLASL